jgi:nitroreductase
MEYSKLIANRYSVRAYRPDSVEDEKLRRVLEAACLAPTASNRQPFQIIVVHTQGRENELRRVYHQPWFVQAPLILCAVGLPRESWVRSADKRRYLDVDVAIVMDHLILEAANQGLGTCWIAAFNAKAAREALRLPDEVEPLIFTPLGYPADTPGPKVRKPLDSLVRFEHW